MIHVTNFLFYINGVLNRWKIKIHMIYHILIVNKNSHGLSYTVNKNAYEHEMDSSESSI